MRDKDAEPDDWGEVFAELRAEEVEIDPFEALSDDNLKNPVEAEQDEDVLAVVALLEAEAVEIRRGKRLLANKHGTHRGPGGDPSVSEIKTMCAAIRSTWRGADLRRSRCGQSDSVETRVVQVGK